MTSEPVAPAHEALLAKALSTSAVLWVEIEPGRSYAVWFASRTGADVGAGVGADPGAVTVLVACGGDEQPLPDLPDQVVIALRSKDSGGRLLRLPARVRTLAASDRAYPEAVTALAARRLNAPQGDTATRWAAAGTRVLALEVLDPADPQEYPGHYDDAPTARPPADSGALTSGWRPWHLRGRPAVRRRLRRR